MALAIAAGGWLYDAGRELAGDNRGASAEELRVLREQIAELQEELSRLRGLTNASESTAKIERTAQEQLVKQLKLLQDENARLKDDLGFFENLGSGGKSEAGPTINRLMVSRDEAPNRYRFRLLVVWRPVRQNEAEFRGNLQLIVNLVQNGKAAIMVLPKQDDADRRQFDLNFKYFQRVDGVFSVPATASVKSVEVKLLQNGVMRATQAVSL